MAINYELDPLQVEHSKKIDRITNNSERKHDSL